MSHKLKVTDVEFFSGVCLGIRYLADSKAYYQKDNAYPKYRGT